jgi:structural maintenance of chromosome 2
MSEYDAKQKDIGDTENLVQTLVTGLSSKEGQDNGYMDQLANAKQLLSTTTSEAQQLKLRLSHLQKEIKSEEPKANKAKKENSSLLNQMENGKKTLEMINVYLFNFRMN